jgi:hypothetical protein
VCMYVCVCMCVWCVCMYVCVRVYVVVCVYVCVTFAYRIKQLLFLSATSIDRLSKQNTL